MEQNSYKNGETQIEKDLIPIIEDGHGDESKYPPIKTVILSMMSIYFSVFLTALVSLLIQLQRLIV